MAKLKIKVLLNSGNVGEELGHKADYELCCFYLTLRTLQALHFPVR